MSTLFLTLPLNKGAYKSSVKLATYITNSGRGPLNDFKLLPPNGL